MLASAKKGMNDQADPAPARGRDTSLGYSETAKSAASSGSCSWKSVMADRTPSPRLASSDTIASRRRAGRYAK